MEAVGGKLIKHYRDLAFMGFWEVVTNLRTILRNIDFCKRDIIQFQPDAIIFIDYPGFNMRIAKWAKQRGDSYPLLHFSTDMGLERKPHQSNQKGCRFHVCHSAF